ncbi:MAG TPA: hypothetical protein VLQ89_08495 [Candidatus Binatia bacterium]|nr:hypothetical protein [Candidatus Binatia bacterium]
MATLIFTIDEAMNILAANQLLPERIKDIQPDADGLLATVSGGIVIRVRRESFANGILKLTLGSSNWAYKLADSLGKVDKMLDEAIRGRPFIRRENKSLFIDLNRALQGRVRGVQVKKCELVDGAFRIEF